jgi:leader peptidase (prepilin peptidase)/N-methyltransferase
VRRAAGVRAVERDEVAGGRQADVGAADAGGDDRPGPAAGSWISDRGTIAICDKERMVFPFFLALGLAIVPGAGGLVAGAAGLAVGAGRRVWLSDLRGFRILDRDVLVLGGALLAVVLIGDVDLADSLWGVALLGGVGLAFHVVPGLLVGRGLGFGDVKLMAVLGLATGIEGAGPALMVAAAVSCAMWRFGPWRRYVPLGPGLLAGAVLAIGLRAAAA